MRQCFENDALQLSTVPRLTKAGADNEVVSESRRHTSLGRVALLSQWKSGCRSVSVQFSGNVSAFVQTLPARLDEARSWFRTAENCISLIASRRWRDGEVLCPVCGLPGPRFLGTRGLWECRADHPKKQFSVRAGTLFEESHVSLEQWLTAIWILANSSRKVSSYRLARELGITQKSAWFLLFRIRAAFRLARGRLQAQIGLRHAPKSL